MHSLKWSLATTAVALSLGAATPASAQYSNIYVFGDSLSDVGSFKPVLPPGTGLFTTNPGPVYATIVANDLGFSATPSNQNNGNDFAQGGARVTLTPGFGSGPALGATPVTTQITQFLGRGPADPNALYVVWAGANDLFFQLGQAQAGAITPAQAQAAIGTAATELVAQVVRLRAAGAQYIVVFNLPDIGSTPSGPGSGQAANLTALSSFFNSTVATGLNQAGVQAVRLNTFALLNEVIANPALYGFSNVTTPACGALSSLVCTAANFVAPNADRTFLFADTVHPTTAGHAVLAQYVEATLRAPQQVAALAEAPLATEQAVFRSIDARMMSAAGTPPRTRYETWVSYDYSNPDIRSGFLSGDGKLDTVAVGLDMQVSAQLLVGVAFDYTNNKTDFAQSGFKLRETSGTLYAGYGTGPWWFGATVGASDLDYRDIHRDIALGAAVRTEKGETHGYATTARVLGGYELRYGNISHGPVVRFSYEDIKVNGYSEQGAMSTTMSFDEQKRKSAIGSAGWQAYGAYGAVRPFVRAEWEHEFKDDVRFVSASVVGTGGGSFSVPAFQPDKDWALFTAGISTEFGRVTGYLSGSATAGKSDGNAYGVTVGVRVPL